MHLVALTHVDNRQQSVVRQDVAKHSMRRPLARLHWQLASMARQVALVPRPLARLRQQLALVRRQVVLVEREAWGLRSVVAWAERYDFYSSRRRRRLFSSPSSDD